MPEIILFATILLPVSAIGYGVFLGLFDSPIPDYDGILELTEDGIYEHRIL